MNYSCITLIQLVAQLFQLEQYLPELPLCVHPIIYYLCHLSVMGFCLLYIQGNQPTTCATQTMSDYSKEVSKKNMVDVGTNAGDYKLVAVHEGHHIYKPKVSHQSTNVM